MGPYPKALVGRGAMEAKGPYVAWLNALETIIAVGGTLPFNPMTLADGEEEIVADRLLQILAED